MIHPLFVIKHGPRGSDGMPISHEFVSLGDWDVEHIPDGTQLGCVESMNIEINKLQTKLDAANKLIERFMVG